MNESIEKPLRAGSNQESSPTPRRTSDSIDAVDETATAASAIKPAAGPPRPGFVLFAVCVAVLILPASLTGTSVALPAIGEHLGGNVQELQWVVNAYNLTFACFMLAAGSLADIWGRRRVFMLGSALFIFASTGSAFAPHIGVLIALRALAGVGAAAVMTAGSAVLATSFSGAQQAKAFALLGSAAGAGLAFGPSLSGALISFGGWPGVFLAHALIAASAWSAVRALPESKNPATARIDIPGVALFATAMVFLTLAIVQAAAWGPTDGRTLALAAGSLLAFVTFAVWEEKTPHPMLDLSLLRHPVFMGVCLVPVVLTGTFVSLLVQTPILLTGAKGFPAGQVGGFMLIMTLPVLFVPAAVAKAIAANRMSRRGVLALSLVLAGIGALTMSMTGPTMSTFGLAASLLLVGTGMGVSAGTVDGIALSVLGPEKAGTAAGLFNTMRLASEALGIALISAVIVARSTTLTAHAHLSQARARHLSNLLAAGTPKASSAAPEWDTAARAFTQAFQNTYMTTGLISLLAAATIYHLTRGLSPATK